MRIFLLPLFTVLFLFSSRSTNVVVEAHNITRILEDHPEFSTFNHYLTATHLASEINQRLTMTVLALDNAAMSSLLARHFTLPTLKNVLSLHVLVDYFGAKKLHQLTSGSALSSSIFQSTGSAPGTSGFVNITDHRKGHVTFSAILPEGVDAGTSPASFVKSVKEVPYNISVVQISSPLSNPEAEAPAAAPAPVNITTVLSKNGCKMFADLLTSISDVITTYEGSLNEGLTIFCPVDGAIKTFMPKFKNLTAEHKASLLLYHAEPVYSSMQMLKQHNGAKSTLATEGKKKNFIYTVQNDGLTVTLETKVVTATIGKTVLDQDPVAIYSIDKVLQPKDLFKVVVEVPADAPEADAPAAPKTKKKAKKKGVVVEAPAPAGPEESPADDQKAADENACTRIERWGAAVVAAAVTVVAMTVVIV